MVDISGNLDRKSIFNERYKSDGKNKDVHHRTLFEIINIRNETFDLLNYSAFDGENPYIKSASTFDFKRLYIGRRDVYNKIITMNNLRYTSHVVFIKLAIHKIKMAKDMFMLDL